MSILSSLLIFTASLWGDKMTIYLYNNADAPNRLDKNLSSPATITVSNNGVNMELGVTRPIITAAGNLTGYNYAKIPDFDNRYYFIDDITIIRDGISQLRLRVDVLMSFNGDIKVLPAIAKRVGTEDNPDLFSPYIVDPRQEFKAYHTTRSFVVGDLDAAGLSPVFILATVST